MKNIKKIISLCLSAVFIFGLTACANNPPTKAEPVMPEETVAPTEEIPSHESTEQDFTNIVLSDEGVVINGTPATSDGDVYAANDIVYYESDKDFTYGEGTDSDAHTAEEAAAHTVVHITKPGDYFISGIISAGQIAVDLGEDAKTDPNAIVNLYLNGVSITNSVAPGIIFYNVYECGDDNTEIATANVDTSSAGANIFIVGGTENTINGAYVSRIYDPASIVLSEDNTTIKEAKTLHKYDGAVYSRMTMNINSWDGDSGVLIINAENEGLDTEMHLTINGGYINIHSGNDGINTNKDGISVTTINNGTVHIVVTGTTGEGDGIDSKGWVVINDGSITAQACDFSMNAGIDSDMGTHINGGVVCVTGNMLDTISNSTQNFVVFEFEQPMYGALSLMDISNNTIASCAVENGFKYLLFSNVSITPGEYTLWEGFGIQHQGYAINSLNNPNNTPSIEENDTLEEIEISTIFTLKECDNYFHIIRY